MFCPKCGKELKQDDFNVCPYCGYDLHLPVQQNDNDNDGNDENVIRFGWLKAIGILIPSIIAFLIVINVVTSVMNYISIRNQTSTVTPTTSTSSSVSTSKQKKSSNNYEGYVNENSYVCTDYDTLIELDDALRHGDKEHMKSLFCLAGSLLSRQRQRPRLSILACWIKMLYQSSLKKESMPAKVVIPLKIGRPADNETSQLLIH